MQTYPNSLLPTTATAPRFPTEPVEGDDTMAPPLLCPDWLVFVSSTAGA